MRGKGHGWGRRVLVTLLVAGMLAAVPTTATAQVTLITDCADTAAVIAQLEGGGAFEFDCGGTPVELDLSTGEIEIDEDTTIIGNGVVFDGSQDTRIFHVTGAATSFNLDGVTLRDGTVEGLAMGASGDGGAIYNDGATLYFSNGVIADSDTAIADAQNPPPQGGDVSITASASARGGAIFNRGGRVTIIGSTLSDNIAAAATEAEFDATGMAEGRATAQALGGAIFNDGGELTIIESNLIGNGAAAAASSDTEAGTSASSTAETLAYGGTIYSTGGSVTLLRSVIDGSEVAAATSGEAMAAEDAAARATSSARGGAVYSAGGTLLITESTLNDDSAAAAAAAEATGGSTNSSETDSTSTAQGGAVYVEGGTFTITRSTLSGGADASASAGEAVAGELADAAALADARGAGLFNAGGDGQIFTSTISGNVSASASAVDSEADLTSGHAIGIASADAAGASVASEGGPLSILNSTIADATAASAASANADGGTVEEASEARASAGIFANDATITILSTILSTAFLNCHTTETGAIVSLGHNLSNDDTCFPADPSTGDQVVADVGIGVLQDNGGPTFTHLPNPDSPAIDAGDCEPGFDQRLFLRSVDGDGDGSAVCDVGATEVDSFPIEPKLISPRGTARAQAGDPIYVRFLLGGNFGSEVLESAQVQRINCSTGAPIGPALPAQLAGPPRYFPGTNSYTLTWRTQRAWADTCQTLLLRFVGGSEMTVTAQFSRNR